jgi:hypothetical protein
MFLKKGEKYLLTYNISNYTEIGTYIGIIHYDDNGIEYMFKANGCTVSVLEEEIKKCIDEPRATDWEKIADQLIGFAEIVKMTEGNSTKNSEYYNRACEVIEEYERLKNE